MKNLSILMLALLFAVTLQAQVGLNGDGSTPDPSAMLDVKSTSRGFLAPRMTAEHKAAISSPATGLLVYQTDAPAGYYYNSGTPATPAWVQLGVASGSSQWTNTGNDIYYNTGNVYIGTTRTNYELISPDGILTIADSNYYQSKVLKITKTGSVIDGYSYGLYSTVNGSVHNTGIGSLANGTETDNTGVWSVAQGSATDNYGIRTRASEGTRYNYGVYSDVGGSSGNLNYAGYFKNYATTGTKYGIYSIVSQGGTTNIGGHFSATGATNNYGLLVSEGNVGIGFTTPIYPLHLSSGAHVTNAGVWTNASDARLKTNVVNTTYGLQTVMQLRPVNYTMVEGGEAQVGFLAQEVQKIVPEVVSGTEGDIEKGETLGLSYGNLVPVLTKAIQQQQSFIEHLNKRVNALESQNKDLSQKAEILDQLKAEVEALKKAVNTTILHISNEQ